MAKIKAEELKQKYQRMLNTFVREKWGEIPSEMEVKFKNLKLWGFDLISGLRGGAKSVFVANEDDMRKQGDVYEEEGEKFEVQEILKSIPKGAKLIIRVSLEERRGVIRAYYRSETGEETLLFTLPAADLLLVYFKKRGYGKLLESFHACGLTTEFISKRGDQGRAANFEALPLKMRRVMREAWDIIRKRTKTGRFTLAYFGKNKDGDDRYIITWLVPTIYLFDSEIAERIDKLLSAIK